MKRPDHLPDFGKPPLNEVVMGIQFSAPATYQQIKSGEVWSLYKKEFPIVQDLPPIPPYFETFGQPAGVRLSFGVVAGAQHDRFWFISSNGEDLIQFQSDRLLRNWRKADRLNSEYPRYERIVKDFEDEANMLSDYFISIGGSSLDINQCEITYVNHIVPTQPGPIKPSDWLSFVRFGDPEPDDFSCTFRRQIDDEAGHPIGRLTFESATTARPDGQEFIALTITARAMPREPNLKSSLEFFAKGREMIVKSFTEVTTDSAHKVWERIH